MLVIRLGKLLKEQEEQIKNRDESLEKAREEIKWLRGMLKEQEAKKITISQVHCGIKYGLCPKCGKQVDTFANPNYCGYCGQAVKWDE